MVGTLHLKLKVVRREHMSYEKRQLTKRKRTKQASSREKVGTNANLTAGHGIAEHRIMPFCSNHSYSLRAIQGEVGAENFRMMEIPIESSRRAGAACCRLPN